MFYQLLFVSLEYFLLIFTLINRHTLVDTKIPKTQPSRVLMPTHMITLKSISVLTSTYSLLCDILFTTYQLIKSDNRVFTVFEVPLKDCTIDGAPFLIQMTMETFTQIAHLESEVLSKFMLEDKLIHAFLITKLLSISISKYIIKTQFYQKIKLKRGL